MVVADTQNEHGEKMTVSYEVPQESIVFAQPNDDKLNKDQPIDQQPIEESNNMNMEDNLVIATEIEPRLDISFSTKNNCY